MNEVIESEVAKKPIKYRRSKKDTISTKSFCDSHNELFENYISENVR